MHYRDRKTQWSHIFTEGLSYYASGELFSDNVKDKHNNNYLGEGKFTS